MKVKSMNKILGLGLALLFTTFQSVAEPNYCDGLDTDIVSPTDPNDLEYWGTTLSAGGRYLAAGYQSADTTASIVITCRYLDTTGFHNVPGFPVVGFSRSVGASAGPFYPCPGVKYVEMMVKRTGTPMMVVTWTTSK